MANTLAYTLHSIQDSFDHCDIGVAIPQFKTCDGAQLDSVNTVIVNAIQDIVDAFFGWRLHQTTHTWVHQKMDWGSIP